MNRLTILVIITIVIASFFAGYFINGKSNSLEIKDLQEQITNLQQEVNKLQTKEPKDEIPNSVLLKYTELEAQYNNSLGADMKFCTKGTENIYTVSGSGGFTGVTFYYNEDGTEIGSHYFTDAIDVNNPPPKPPVNILEYNCTFLKKSK